jgi:hypothetical protein
MKHKLEIEDRCWNESLPLLHLPRFKCPCCHAGHFVVGRNSLRSGQTSQSIKEQEIIGDVDSIRNRFITIAICDNPDCKEPMAISGWSKLHPVSMKDEELHEDYHGPRVDYVPDYTITYLSAPVALIRVPFEIDGRLQELLDSAFLSFWSESHACANKIRQVLEYLLDEKFKIPKQDFWSMKCSSHKCLREPKQRELTLGQQIDAFIAKEDKSPLQRHFKALRELGNSGSHITDNNIDRTELMNAFKILESLLDELYKDNGRIDTLSEGIIQSRKCK